MCVLCMAGRQFLPVVGNSKVLGKWFGLAKQAGLARQLQQAGDQVADMFEVCTDSTVQRLAESRVGAAQRERKLAIWESSALDALEEP